MSTASAPSAATACTRSMAAASPAATTAMTTSCSGPNARCPSRKTPMARATTSGAAVDRDGRTGDEDGVVRDEEGQHGGQLGRLWPNVVLRVGQGCPVGGRVDDAGQDAVHPHPV